MDKKLKDFVLNHIIFCKFIVIKLFNLFCSWFMDPFWFVFLFYRYLFFDTHRKNNGNKEQILFLKTSKKCQLLYRQTDRQTDPVGRRGAAAHTT